MMQSEQPKPINCFLLFCKENRESLRRRHPSLNNSDITSKLGEEWRSMSSINKDEYKRKASLLKKVSFYYSNNNNVTFPLIFPIEF